MANYSVRFYTGNYGPRQQAANADQAKLYCEHHFNSNEGAPGSYSVAITGSNASQTSRNWGRWYAQAVSQEFGTSVGGDQGILVGGYGGRGDGNIRQTNMPAILLEPLFANNPAHATLIRSADGQLRLARILAESVRRFCPDGGLIAFSVGHKYKTSHPNDRGTAVLGGGAEADFAEQVLLKAKTLLESAPVTPHERQIRVMRGNQELLRLAIDENANISWDSVGGLLQINP